MLALPSELRPGTWIGERYQIVRRIGCGGVGVVYEAEHKTLGRRVAIKLLHPEQLHRETGKERFEREARMAASINHRHVVAVHDFDTHRGVPYLVMELLRGHGVDEILRESGRLPLQRGLQLLLEASRGLEVLHAKGLVHRDLKPANLFVTEVDGAECCKILDFGITKPLADPNLTATDALMGTPAYMAPEQLDCPTEVDHRVDIYALGATAWVMLTGQELYTGTPHRVLHQVATGELPPPAVFTSFMPERLAGFVRRCLSKRREDRPQTAAECSAELAHILASLTLSLGDKVLLEPEERVPSSTPAPSASGRRPLILPVLLSCVAVACLLVAFFLAVRDRSGEPRERVRAEGSAAPPASPSKVSTPAPGVRPVEALGREPRGAERATVDVAQKITAESPPSTRRVTRRTRSLRRAARLDGEARGRPSEAPPSAATSESARAREQRPAGGDPGAAPPGFVSRSAPPGFVPRGDPDGADSPDTPAGDKRRRLAPGHLFRPRPKD